MEDGFISRFPRSVHRQANLSLNSIKSGGCVGYGFQARNMAADTNDIEGIKFMLFLHLLIHF